MNKFYAVFTAVFLVILFAGSAYAQIKLPQKQTKSEPKPTQEKTTKKEEKKEYKGLVLTLKVTSNAPCKFYVDGEFMGIVSDEQIFKTELSKGEYQLKAVSTENDADVFQAFYTVEQVSVEKFYEIDLQKIINNRLAAEKAEADAKRQAQQREEERLKREAQEARDKVERENQYNAAIEKANDYYLDKNYDLAEVQYKKALELKPSSSEAKTGMENITYNKAVKYDTEEWYNYYISTYASGSYISDIKKRNEIRKEENAYQRAKSSNQMDDYESYVNKYPNGKYSAEAKKIIEESYFTWGQTSFNSKNYDDAKKQLEYYINRYPSGRYTPTARDLKTKTERKLRTLNRDDFFYLDYAFDMNAFIGLSIGTYNQRNVGMYFTSRLNSDLFTSTTYFKTDNNYSTGSSDYVPTFNTRYGKLDGILGITYGPVHPLWVYMGLGMGYYPTFYEFRDTWYTDETLVWARNVDRTRLPILHEFGLAIAVNPINLSAGVCLRNYNEAFMMFSFGFSIPR